MGFLVTGLLASGFPLSLNGQAFSYTTGMKLRAEYTDNVFLNSDEESDAIFFITPVVNMSRNGGLFEVKVEAGAEFQEFADLSSNNSTNPFASIRGFYNNQPLGASAVIDYETISEANTFVGTFLQTENLLLRGGLSYRFSSITRINTLVYYETIEPKTSKFNDRQIWTIDNRVLYRYSRDLGLVVGIRYRRSEVTSTTIGTGTPNNSEDITLTAEAEGQLAATLEGEVEAGIQQRSFENAEENDGLRPFLSLDLIWTINSLTRFELVSDFDYTTTVSNLSAFSFGTSGTLYHSFTEQLEVNAGVGFEDISFIATTRNREQREDTQWDLFGGLSYQLTDWGSIGAQLGYAKHNSNEDFFTYDVFRSTISASATF